MKIVMVVMVLYSGGYLSFNEFDDFVSMEECRLNQAPTELNYENNGAERATAWCEIREDDTLEVIYE